MPSRLRFRLSLLSLCVVLARRFFNLANVRPGVAIREHYLPSMNYSGNKLFMGRDRSVRPLVSMDRRKTDDLDPSRVSDLTLMRTDVANCDECEKERMMEGDSNRYIYIYVYSFLSSMDLRFFSLIMYPENRSGRGYFLCFLKFQSGSADGMQGIESGEFGGGVNERIGGGRARSHFLSRVPEVPVGSTTGDRGPQVRQAQN